ncbi:GCG_CRPN prefix-to-repeats domain-containing protein [uncultured Methylobacterium sp.]|uniref:GCG_CRPN prefix-to-repeats domain-containing protein n=1 Tax=uncultured Methylobacterium sp. TaxID=157278 RepID=UPI0035C9EF62
MIHVRDIWIAGLVASGLGLAAPADAAPLAQDAAAVAGEPAAVAVAYGCGRGYAPGRYGGCRPMYRGYGAYGPRRIYGYDGPRYGVVLPGVRIRPYGAGFSID